MSSAFAPAPQSPLGSADASAGYVLLSRVLAYLAGNRWLLFRVAVGYFISKAILSNFIPSRLNPHQTPKSQYGFCKVDTNPPPNERGVDIIFVHGLASNPDTTWLTSRKTLPGMNLDDTPADSTKQKEGVNWVTDLFQEDIPADLRKSVRLFFYNYDSYWMRDARDTRLSLLADELLNHINASIRSSPREESRKLMFVAHCYGGLVVKKALVSAMSDTETSHITKQTIATVFLGTPHDGTPLSFFGRIEARLYRFLSLRSSTVLLNDLAVNSTTLMDLQKQFAKVVGDRHRVINFHEQFASSQLPVLGGLWREFTVPEASATFSGRYVSNIGLGTNHRGLNKFGFRGSLYNQVCLNLTNILKKHFESEQTLFSVPLELAENYTPRQALQQQLERALSDDRGDCDFPHAAAVIGMGGTGKSQLALNFANAHKSAYNPALWIDATSKETVQASFQRCFDDLKKSLRSFQEIYGESPKNAPTVSDFASSYEVRSVLAWLKSRSTSAGDDPWLVIIDNADDVTWGIRRVLPKGALGTIVITSQDMETFTLVPKGCQKIYLEAMDPQDALALLLNHMGLKEEETSDTVIEQCKDLVEQLGYLVLAVSLAGYRIANEDDSEEGLRQYLADYARHRDDLLKDNTRQGLAPSKTTVWTAWDMALNRIDTLHDGGLARLLLTWLALFNDTTIGKHIMNKVFRAVRDLLEHKSLSRFRDSDNLVQDMSVLKPFTLLKKDGTWDDYKFRAACDQLARYGLIQKTTGKWDTSYTMHKLVQWRALQEVHKNNLAIIFFATLDKAHEIEIFSLLPNPPSHAEVLYAVRKVDEVYGVMTGFGIGRLYRRTRQYKRHDELMDCMEEIATKYPEEAKVRLMEARRIVAIQRKQWKKAMQYHDRLQPLRVELRGPSIAALLEAASLCGLYAQQGKMEDAKRYGEIIKGNIYGNVDPEMTMEELYTVVLAYKNMCTACKDHQEAKYVWMWLLSVAVAKKSDMVESLRTQLEFLDIMFSVG